MIVDYGSVLGMATPASYQITVKGMLAKHWADWFNGSTITIERSVDGRPHTIMLCKIRDQAELLGILNQLNSLNLPLLEVTFLKDNGF